MKRALLFLAALAVAGSSRVFAETETIDLKALAKKARPAVMLLVVSNAAGREIATGTGFLVSSDGKLITNHHVIEGAASAIAKAENGGLFPVEGVLAADPKNNLVLLKLTGKDLPFLTLGDSDKIEVGTRIAVIGSPLGLEGTLSEGIVSAYRDLGSKAQMLQITAAISPGSSGSPLLNAKGEVVGVATALLREGQSLNFAIPVEGAKALLGKQQSAGNPTRFPAASATDAADFDVLVRDADFWASYEAEKKGDYAEALKRIKLVAARYPYRADVYTQMGRIYMGLGFGEEAKVAYDKASKLLRERIDTKPEDDSAWQSLGELYSAQGKYAEAVVAYKQAVQTAPSPLQWSNLGAAYFNNEDYPNAIAAYRLAIKLVEERLPDDPISAMFWGYLGDAYAAATQLDNAIGAYKQVIKLVPKHSEAWSKLGVVFRRAGRADEANEAFQRAREFGPSALKHE
jgi:tetratricopeptide (TPR) repeat protein